MRCTVRMPKIGDVVNDLLAETDKANLEIPSPFTGIVIHTLVSIGEEVVTSTPTLAIEA
jgi:pyruvate/2-oxoglutarate dehydrogenase complex dihydrolipoamide acyltransferase (E2) component